MFVALSKFVVANGMTDQVRQAFRERPHLVDGVPGFVRMQVMNPRERPDEFWLVTCWEREEDFRAWRKGHQFHDSHRGIPKGLKLIPNETAMRFFDLVCE